jgi:hypothetical protein
MREYILKRYDEYRNVLIMRDEKKYAEAFLFLLFAPFFPQMTDDKMYSNIYGVFIDRYRTSDLNKDYIYVKNTLEELISKRAKLRNDLLELMVSYIRDESAIEKVHWFVYDLVVDVYFNDKRTNMFAWLNIAKRYKNQRCRKMIISAPMGLGKSFAIAERLARSRYRAVIFAPDMNLRNYLTDKINRIAGDGTAVAIEGITDVNCPEYGNITGARQLNKNIKPTACNRCGRKKRGECETWNQKWQSWQSRILVACHAQYEAFYRLDCVKYWYNHKNNSWQMRDFFIVDENILDKHLFELPSIDLGEFKQYHLIFNKYRRSGLAAFKKAINRIEEVITLRDESLFIPVIDKDLNLSKDENKLLKRLLKRGYEREKLRMPAKNLTNLLCMAIRNGCAYDEYSGNIYCGNDKEVKFPLGDNVPFHIFFDATNVPDYLMHSIFPGGPRAIIRMTLDISPLGELRLFHTNNSDLPRGRVKEFIRRLEIYCKNIINEHGTRARYFLVTTGQDEKSKIFRGYEHFIENIFKDKGIKVLKKKKDTEESEANEITASDNDRFEYNYNYAVLRHFGDLRGTNVAKDCDIGLLLGKYKSPDAVEVVWSIPYLDNEAISAIGEEDYILIADMKEKTYIGDDYVYRYRAPFERINMIAEWKRNSENEQALGRTRFLFHPVIFYAVTKDSIKDYDLFKNHADRIKYETDSFGISLFAEKGDSMYIFSEEAIDATLKHETKFTSKEIQEKASKRCISLDLKPPVETTIRKHIRKYIEEHPHLNITRTWEHNTWVYRASKTPSSKNP